MKIFFIWKNCSYWFLSSKIFHLIGFWYKIISRFINTLRNVYHDCFVRFDSVWNSFSVYLNLLQGEISRWIVPLWTFWYNFDGFTNKTASQTNRLISVTSLWEVFCKNACCITMKFCPQKFRAQYHEYRY